MCIGLIGNVNIEIEFHDGVGASNITYNVL